jgi:hypothetical protein
VASGVVADKVCLDAKYFYNSHGNERIIRSVGKSGIVENNLRDWGGLTSG